MDSQILFVFQKTQYGVRYGADSQLQAGVVLNQLGTITPNGLVQRGDGRGFNIRGFVSHSTI